MATTIRLTPRAEDLLRKISDVSRAYAELEREYIRVYDLPKAEQNAVFDRYRICRSKLESLHGMFAWEVSHVVCAIPPIPAWGEVWSAQHEHSPVAYEAEQLEGDYP